MSAALPLDSLSLYFFNFRNEQALRLKKKNVLFSTFHLLFLGEEQKKGFLKFKRKVPSISTELRRSESY